MTRVRRRSLRPPRRPNSTHPAQVHANRPRHATGAISYQSILQLQGRHGHAAGNEPAARQKHRAPKTRTCATPTDRSSRDLPRTAPIGYEQRDKGDGKDHKQSEQHGVHDHGAHLRTLLSLPIMSSNCSPSEAVRVMTRMVSLPASEPRTSGSSAASMAAAMPRAVPG